MVSVEGLEDYIEDEQYRYLTPIDVWVFRIGEELGIFDTGSAQWETNSAELVEACGEDISPLDFDQGAWYLGVNSFDVLTDNLENLSIEAVGESN